MVDMIFLLGIVAGAAVPGNSFSTKGYVDDSYYDHIIDWSIEHLNLIRQGFTVTVKEPDWGEGTITFNGLRSLNRNTGDRFWKKYQTQSKRLKNGDLDLLNTFQLGNISGVANFSGDNGKPENQKHSFEFRGTPPKVQVLFMLTKDQFLKRVAFQFVELPLYSYSPPLTLNVTRLLVERGSTAFHRLFKDLYNIIYGRIILTADRHDTYFDKVLDNVFIRSSRDLEQFTNHNQVSKLSPNETIKAELKINIRGLSSVKRMKRAHFMDELNGDIDLRTTIQLGNASGKASISGMALETVFEDSFTFTLPPVVVEALFYLPRNQSHQQMSFHFETKPNFTIQPEKEYFRSHNEKLLKEQIPSLYGQAIHYLLNETHNEVFPKTNKAAV